MAGNVWILAESWAEKTSDATYELLALGRELADALDVSLEALAIGHRVETLAEDLGLADNVLCIDSPAFEGQPADLLCAAIASLMKARQPGLLLVPMTNVSWDVLGLLPAISEAPFISLCTDVTVNAGSVEAHSLLFGGKIAAVTRVVDVPTVLGIQPGSRSRDRGVGDGAPNVERVDEEIEGTAGVRFVKYLEPEATDVDITQHDVLVAVGRGLRSGDNLELAEELAEALGGVVCSSRPVIDQGWLPMSRQVGKSGANVSPKLYLALGISGAPEHVEGMKNSDLIIAVNTDPDAPIFNVARYGVEEDLFDIAEALTERLKAVNA